MVPVSANICMLYDRCLGKKILAPTLHLTIPKVVGRVDKESRKTRDGDTVTESDDTSVTVDDMVTESADMSANVGDTYVNVIEDID